MKISAKQLPSPFRSHLNRRGVTLVELMVVVAVIGILATFAIVSYSDYVEEGKMTELRQYSMDVARAQQQYFSHNHEYYQPGNQTYDPAEDDAEWTQILEFNAQVPAGVDIAVAADIDGNCNICDGVDPSTDGGAWFAVRSYNSDIERSVFMTSAHDRPVPVDGAWDAP